MCDLTYAFKTNYNNIPKHFSRKEQWRPKFSLKSPLKRITESKLIYVLSGQDLICKFTTRKSSKIARNFQIITILINFKLLFYDSVKFIAS